MNLITLDFETYYDKEYSLSKMTTEAYVRDPRFEALILGIKINDERSYSVVGRDISAAMLALDLHQHAVVMHHAHFDGLILSHHYGVSPKIIFDTLAMGRAEIGSVAAKGLSLGSLSEHLGIGKKGHDVVLAQGKHQADFTAEDWMAYRGYCCNDVDLTHRIHSLLMPRFSVSELKLIDLTTRLFTEPVLELDVPLLEEYKQAVIQNKEYLMSRAGVTREELMSNAKFAGVLRRLGVEPPTKISAKTGKEAYAFAKTDEAMVALTEHPDETVQILAEARLGVKTTIAESRAQRFIDMAGNGSACIYLNYWGAEQTGRHGGGGKTNFQNMGRNVALTEDYAFPGRRIFTPEGIAAVTDPGAWGLTKIATDKGQFKPKDCHRLGLRDSVRAPEGHVLVVGDSSNIEARKVCWLAGQKDILDVYRNGGDPYCDMASSIYDKPVTKANTVERMLGKVSVLGLGFGMGKQKFYDTATGPQWGIDVPRELTDRGVDVFRDKYYKVKEYWAYQNDVVIPAMASGKAVYADPHGLMVTCQDGLILPNGRTLRYPNLRQRKNPDPDSYFKNEWVFDVREGARVIPTRLYGGKMTENEVQALARIVVMDQAVTISRRYRVVLLVHDEVVCCVPEDQAEACEKYMLEVMSTPPGWAKTLPVAAETGVNNVYSLAK